MRQLDSPRQGVLENEASLCRDSPCAGGFETRPYEDHSGVNHIPGTETVSVTIGFPGTETAPEIIGFPGTAAPQCGKPEIIPKVHTVPVTVAFPGAETVPGTETAPEIIGFPGTAAPQCGISSEVTEANWA
ncbi:MAG: hypothetical protein NTV33_06995 [Coprothermobacterota bacterium]|nr:hypothetical protein [Coprothermobacterota bacterium]